MRKFLSLLALAPLVASCGGNAVTGRQGNINQGGLQTLMPAFNTLIAGLRPGAAPTLPTQGMPGGITTSAIREAAVPTCVTESPSTVVDKDNDGIALLKEYKFNCTNELSGTDTYKYSGTTKIEDTDDTKKWSLGGYKITFDSVSSYKGAKGGEGAYAYKGYWYSIAQGPATVYKSDYTAAIKSKLPAHPDQDMTLHSVWNMTVTGANETTPWLAGTWSGGGLYELAGTFYYEDAAGKRQTRTGANVTLEFKAVDLKYDQTCGEYYKSGSWLFKDGSGNTYEVRYDCTSKKAYLNGTLQP